MSSMEDAAVMQLSGSDMLIAELRDRLAAVEAENEWLKAQLAAVPVEAIRGVMSEDPLGDDLDAVAAWLGIEVQP